jgi:hypothetical protein
LKTFNLAGKMNFLIFEGVDQNLEDNSTYSEDFREKLLEDDEISPNELAFMYGYDDVLKLKNKID